MKIKILSEEKLETLSTKENLDIIEKYIKDNPTNEWLKDVFKVDEPFTLSKVDMEDFEMDMSAERPEDTDFENAKRLYKNLDTADWSVYDRTSTPGYSSFENAIDNINVLSNIFPVFYVFLS